MDAAVIVDWAEVERFTKRAAKKRTTKKAPPQRGNTTRRPRTA